MKQWLYQKKCVKVFREKETNRSKMAGIKKEEEKKSDIAGFLMGIIVHREEKKSYIGVWLSSEMGMEKWWFCRYSERVCGLNLFARQTRWSSGSTTGQSLIAWRSGGRSRQESLRILRSLDLWLYIAELEFRALKLCEANKVGSPAETT